ncbi:MAG: hypothetical protein LBD23_11260 [Oscillospiraceae bacterium]|jgi:hypothetical protein|nr:hypothetical protein [Oscillospiraceae bacterium]
MERNAFGEFYGLPPNRVKNENIEELYNYEKHYMELIRLHKDEISFINGLLIEFRRERVEFFEIKIHGISESLDKHSIDEPTKKRWLSELVDCMNRSFEVSESLITNYLTKDLEDFKKNIEERLCGLITENS